MEMEYNKRLTMQIKNIRQIIILILLLPLITAASADTVHITYMSFVDPGLGFYKVIDETTHQPSQYVNHILTINQGDTIIWKNDADTPNTAMAIVSEQNLFPDAVLNTNTAVFPYVFDQGGKYTFHLGERTTLIQTILVRSTSTPIPTPAPTLFIPTPVATAIIPAKITPIPTPVATAIIPTKDAPVPTPVATAIIPTVKPSLIQIVSIIVVILSIYITYKTGKDKD